MRYKPKRPKDEDLFPIRVDLTDLEALLSVVPGCELSVETEDCVFDGIEDLAKNLSRPKAFERITLSFPHEPGYILGGSQRIAIKSLFMRSSIECSGDHTTQYQETVRSFLRNVQRPKARNAMLWGAVTWLVLFSSKLATLTVVSTGKAASTFFVAVAGGGLVYVVMDLGARSIVVPRRKEPSFIRRNTPTWIAAIVLTTIGALISATVAYYFK